MEQMTPDDSLWVEILLREKDLQDKNAQVLREELRRGGFPQRIIEEFLTRRSAGIRGSPTSKQATR